MLLQRQGAICGVRVVNPSRRCLHSPRRVELSRRGHVLAAAQHAAAGAATGQTEAAQVRRGTAYVPVHASPPELPAAVPGLHGLCGVLARRAQRPRPPAAWACAAQHAPSIRQSTPRCAAPRLLAPRFHTYPSAVPRTLWTVRRHVNAAHVCLLASFSLQHRHCPRRRSLTEAACQHSPRRSDAG